NVQERAQPGERGWKAGEEQHDGEDQPDVVRLPDRADGVRDELALPILAWAAGEQVPYTTAEVRAREQRVRVESQEDRACENVGERHGTDRYVMRGAWFLTVWTGRAARIVGPHAPRTTHSSLTGSPLLACKTLATPALWDSGGCVGREARRRSRRGNSTAG